MEVPAYQLPLQRALAHALDHLGRIDDAPVAATVSLDELRARLGRPLDETGVDAAQVIDELVAGCAGGILGSAGGRFFGWVMGGSTPAALAADWLTSAWDQNAASVATSPAEAVIEEVCGAWLKELLGLPTSASFALVTGSQMGHVTCLAAARNALLARSGWDVERDGLAARRPAPHQQRPASRLDRTRRTATGYRQRRGCRPPGGRRGTVASRGAGRSSTPRLGRPTVVILQAGDLNIGAFDPYRS